jgi:hypothetical protein
MKCLLCHFGTNPLEPDVFICPHCGLVFKNPTLHMSKEFEIKRYSTHNNDKEDQGYVDFLNKLAIPLAKTLPVHFNALDFGCGPGPTLSILLEKIGGTVENYDPLFFPNKELLKQKFDLVTASEVVEHFKEPELDWLLLVELVKHGGVLGIMTLLYNPSIDYKKWWYKNDSTHVVFYQEKTLLFIAKEFGLDVIFNDNNSVIIFKKK